MAKIKEQDPGQDLRARRQDRGHDLGARRQDHGQDLVVGMLSIPAKKSYPSWP